MAEEEPMLTSPPTQDVAAHVADYARFHPVVEVGRGRVLHRRPRLDVLIKAYW